MKKKKAKRIFQEELVDPAFQEPYAKAIEIVRGILEEYQEKSKAADHHRIEMISSRIKTPQSAYDKLKRKGKELTAESAKKNLNDLAGMRVICCYYEDVYQVSNMLLSRPELTLVKQKDFICNPKSSGYRSLHLIFEVNTLENGVRVEVQIRTITMDAWARLDHELRYKKELDDAGKIVKALRRCSDSIAEVDDKMQEILEWIREA